MEKKSVFVIILTLSLILAINLVSAEILISQPVNLYNYGDSQDLLIVMKEPVGAAQPFSLDVKCDVGNQNLIQIPRLWIRTGEEQITYALLFSKDFLGNLTGTCKFSATFDTETSETKTFEISDKINVNLNLNKTTLDPGTILKVDGTAVLANGKNVNATVEISMQNITSTTSTINGKYSSNINIPKNIKSGTYILNVYVSQKEKNNIINKGNVQTEITITQIPTTIEITTENESYFPNENIKFSSIILDQAGDNMPSQVTTTVYDYSNKIVYQKLLLTDEQDSITLAYNTFPGTWKIESKAFGISADKTITIEKLEKALFKLENSTLTVTNIGNVQYNRSVQAAIDNNTQFVDVLLAIGESKDYKVSAPDGEYNVTITDGVERLEAGRVVLTGAAISVEEIRAQIYNFKNYILVWAFIILISVLAIFTFFRRTIKTNISSYGPVGRGGVEKINIKSQDSIAPIHAHVAPNTLGKYAGAAEHEVEMHGKKEEVAVLAVKIQDIDRIKSTETFKKIAEEIKSSKGAIYESHSYILSIYTSLNTRTFDNDKIALRNAQSIFKIIQEHNKKFKDLINFGIAVNIGELGIRKEEKIKFASIGNTIPLAKRIADLSLMNQGSILLSDATFKKVMNTTKAERKNYGGLVVYALEKTLDREQNTKFISGFLSRNRE